MSTTFQDCPLIDAIVETRRRETLRYDGNQHWAVRKEIVDLGLTGTMIIRFARGKETSVEWESTERLQ